MAGSLVSIKRCGVLLADWFSRGSWRMVDPLYVWSAAAGFLVAFVLIVIASMMQAGRLH
jgi:heme exporter protein D